MFYDLLSNNPPQLHEATEKFFAASKKLDEMLLDYKKDVILREHQLENRERELKEKEVGQCLCFSITINR